MDYLEKLQDALGGEESYAGLGVLEAAYIWYDAFPGSPIPEKMQWELLAMFGKGMALKEEDVLLCSGMIIRSGGTFMLNPAYASAAPVFLDQTKAAMIIRMDGREFSAGEFLRELSEYLECHTSAQEMKTASSCRRMLALGEDCYELQVAFSPVWLPAIAEKAAENRKYVALFGPFAALPWETMIHYYEYAAFRNHTACFDPWHGMKWNISKGGLLTHLDWYFRDSGFSKLMIPPAFSQALFDMGLVRYNDEK